MLLSFRLTLEKDILGGVDVVQSSLERLVDGWENYAVEVSALDTRGKMATRHKMKKVDPIDQIECWDDVQNYQASKIQGDKFTVYIRKPSNPVFYSSINFRIYEGKELTGVTSIGHDRPASRAQVARVHRQEALRRPAHHPPAAEATPADVRRHLQLG